jgi:hypothetical protein
VTLDADATRLVGADAEGQMYMYATRPLLQGSTVSHWDTLARPDLMQEPNASYTVSHDLRIEAALMRDIGWTPFCGNGRLDQQEQCDNGPSNSDTAPDACRSDCTRAHCGDGVVDGGEACDDGATNSDTVSDACRKTCVLPRCGDKVVDRGEQCDNGSANASGAACDTDCHLRVQPTGSAGSGGDTGSGGAAGQAGSGSGGASGGGGGGGDGGCGCVLGSSGAPGGAALMVALAFALGGLLVRRRRSGGLRRSRR